jgi:hypothetical protein
MEIYLEIDSKEVYPHSKERERVDRNSHIQQQAQMEGIKIQK